jgi:hypothetical protein
VKQVVVPLKPNKKQKTGICGQLLNVTDLEAFDKKAFADARGINYSSLGGMIGQMTNRSGIYLDLRKRGFTDVQIPEWVKRPEVVPGAVPEPGAGAVPEPGAASLPGPALIPVAAPAGTPAIVTLAQENAASKRVGESVSGRVGGRVSSQVAQVPPLQTTEASIQNATAAAFIQANRELAGTGQCIEAPGSNAPQRWIHDGSIEEMNGGYL